MSDKEEFRVTIANAISILAGLDTITVRDQKWLNGLDLRSMTLDDTHRLRALWHVHIVEPERKREAEKAKNRKW